VEIVAKDPSSCAMASEESLPAPGTPGPSEPGAVEPGEVEPGEVQPPGSRKRPAASKTAVTPKKAVTPKRQPKPKAVTPMKSMKKAKSAASPKGSPKAKAKSKAMAKSKGDKTKKHTLKRPAAVVPLKRPAAAPAAQAGKSAKGSSMEWAVKLQVEEQKAEKDFEEHGEEEEDPGADDMEVDPAEANFRVESEHKDRSKNAKFKKMLKDGQLPKWAVDAWNASCQLSTGRPAAQRKLVNAIISREDATGKLALNLTNPVLDKLKSTYQRHESKDSHKALPKTLFCGKFNLSEDAFQVGLAAGEFQEVIGKDGKVRYSWQVQEHTVSKGSDSRVTLKSESYLTKKDAAFEKARLDGPFIGLFEKNKGQLAIAGPTGQLALCDKETELTAELWTQAQSQLSAAMKFWDNHIKEAKRLLQQVGGDNREDELYNELLLICSLILLLLVYFHSSPFHHI